MKNNIPDISVCIIAKNEEKNIEKCINSVLAIANEIIVLDTGSKDKTKEIAKELGAKVYETKWENDFSKAKNKCIKYAKGEWILFIDSDEVLTQESQNNLLPFLKNITEKDFPLIINFKIINPQINSLNTTYFFRNTLFNSGWGIHFVKPIHEHLYCFNNSAKEIFASELSIFHNGNLSTKEKLLKKSENYISILEKAIDKNKESNENYYYYYYLGNAYTLKGNHKEALKYYFKSMENINKDIFQGFYAGILIRVIKELIFFSKEYDKALDLINKLLELSPKFPDAIFYKGICLRIKKKFHEAISTFEYLNELFVSEEVLNPFHIITLGESLKVLLSFELGRIYSILKDNQKAEEYLLNTYNLSNSLNDSIFHLIKYYLLNNDIENTVKYYLLANENINNNDKENLLTISNKKLSENDLNLFKTKVLDYLLKFDFWWEEEKNILKSSKQYIYSEFSQNLINNTKPNISVCIITKNEEKFIENCIKSILPIAYEVIVLDTGSTDRTKEIVKDLGSKLFETTWKNDFSLARNECISYAKGDWILYLDADERISDYTQKNLLKYILENKIAENEIIYFKVISRNNNETSIFSFYRQALFRNTKEIYFKGYIHEYLFSKKLKLKEVNCPEFEIYHFGQYKRSREEIILKTENYIKILIKSILDNEIKEDNYYYYFFLGRAYSELKEYKKSVKSYYKSISLYNKKGLSKISSTYGNILIMLTHELSFNLCSYDISIHYCNELISISPDFPDAFYYLGYSYQALGDLEKAKNIYNKTLNLLENKNKDLNPLGIVSFENSLKKMILYWLGRTLINIQEGKFDGLRLLKSLFLQTKEKHILFQALKFSLLNDDMEQSLEIFKEISINDYLKIVEKSKKDIQIELLNKLYNSKGWFSYELDEIKNKINYLKKNDILPKISVCIITKNEEIVISNCIKSVLPIAYEVIVLDTGSTDKTREIVKNLGAKLFETIWKNDFSLARNECISYAKGDWILYIDADEVLEENTQNTLLSFINDTQRENDNYIVYNLQIIEEKSEKNSTNSFFRTSLFKNNIGIYFKGKVYEHIVFGDEKDLKKNNALVKVAPNLKIFHKSKKVLSKSELDKKNRDYIKTCLDIIENTNDDYEKLDYLIYVATTYLIVEDYIKAQTYFENALKVLESLDNISPQTKQILYLPMIKNIILNKKDYSGAIVLINEILESLPNYPDFLFYKSICYEYLQDYQKAVIEFEKFFKFKTNFINYQKLGFSIQENLIYPASIELARCYSIIGKEEESIQYLKKAYKLKQDNKDIFKFIIKHYLLKGNLLETVKYKLELQNIPSYLSIKELQNIKHFKTEGLEFKFTQFKLLNDIKKLRGWNKDEINQIESKINFLKKNNDFPVLSVCIISKNEERFIEDCIKSVLPIAHEVIVLDTGSTDKTVKIAKNLGVRVFETNWEEHFSKARNICSSYAEGNWILVLDCDEKISEKTQERLIPFMIENHNVNQAITYSLKVLKPKPDGTTVITYMSLLYKTGFGIKFKGKVYEYLHSDEHEIKVINCPFLEVIDMTHLKRSSNEMIEKCNLYIDMLYKLINSNENTHSLFLFYFYLGNLYSYLKKFDLSIESYLKSIENYKIDNRNKTNATYGNILLMTIRQCTNNDINNKSLKSLFDEFLDLFPYHPDIYFYLGKYYQKKGEFNKSIEFFYKSIELFDKTTYSDKLGFVSFGDTLESMSNYEIGRNCIILEKYIKGIELILKAYKSTNNKNLLLSIMFAYLLLEDLENYLFYKNIYYPEKRNLFDSKESNLFIIKELINLKNHTGWLIEEERIIDNKIKFLEKKN